LEITGGNAEVAENRGIAERAIRKFMQGKKLEIDDAREKKEITRVGNERKAIANVGWGHLVCPFYVAAKWRCVPVSPRTCGTRFYREPAAAMNSGEWFRPGQR
jgi:hypothetical protein